MRGPLLGLALLWLLAGCTEEPPGATGAVAGSEAALPAPRVSAPVSVGDLSGKWVIGDRNEPAPGAVSACEVTQTMQIYQEGETIHGDVTVCGGGCKTLEAFEGVNRRGEVQLTGKFKGNQMDASEDVSYTLSYDARTQHLVGTRNGEPFWAAPFVARPASACD